MFTVGQLAELSGVSIKTLHHYHRLGLVVPEQTSAAGYRLYSSQNLERLQEVLFYRELDYPLRDIHRALRGGTSRLQTLRHQKTLLTEKHRRLARILKTIEASLVGAQGGQTMANEEIFQGLNQHQWNQALEAQNRHLETTYQTRVEVSTPDQAEALNEAAREATQFLKAMAAALRQGKPHGAPEVVTLVVNHIAALNRQRPTTPESYLATVAFLTGDAFHAKVFEAEERGLGAYLLASAYAVTHRLP